MADPEPPRGVFGRPFSEQVAFFRNKLKNLVPTRRWDDIEREAHDTGFMVAGAASADLLTDLGAAVDKAIAEGRGIEDFRRDFRAIVARNGWHGWTGEGSVRGEAWRVGVIYRTNSYTSYAAGRYAQLRAGGFPFWVYFHGGSEHPRLHHLALDGLILPADHPAWAKLYPPSDWGCSCYVVGARSEAGARRLGGVPGKTLPDDWEKLLGKGWDYAPGASVADKINAIAGKVRHWEHAVAKAFMAELPVRAADEFAEAYRALPSTAEDVRRYAQRVLDPPPIDLEGGAGPPPSRTIGLVRSDQVRSIEETTGKNVERFDFSMDPHAIRHILKQHGNTTSEAQRGQRAVTAADYALLPQLLSEADVIEAAGRSGSTGRPLVRLIWDRGFERWEAVMEIREAKRTLALTTLMVKPTRRP